MFLHTKFQNEGIAICQCVYEVVPVTRVTRTVDRTYAKNSFFSPSKNAVQKKKKKKTKRKEIAKFFALCANAILEIAEPSVLYTQMQKEARIW